MSQPSEKQEQQGALAVKTSTGLSASRICMTCQTTFGGELSHCPADASPLVNIDLESLVGTMVGKYKILSDIYPLGCVMYKMLTGKPAFDGESLFAIFDQHLNEQPQPFSKVCLGTRIPIELEEIVFKALEKKAARRLNAKESAQWLSKAQQCH